MKFGEAAYRGKGVSVKTFVCGSKGPSPPIKPNKALDTRKDDSVEIIMRTCQTTI